jgi:hypothetical protein
MFQTFYNRSALVFYILAYNCLIFNVHEHNSIAFLNFVQHVKLLHEVQGNIVHLCGGLKVPNVKDTKKTRTNLKGKVYV